MNSFRGYDLTILDEPMLVAGVATPDSGFANRLLVCTESSLLELRKDRIEKTHNRAFFTDVSLKRSFGSWKLEISTHSGELKYTGERDELERIAQFLRQWEHETDYRTETPNDSTEHTASEPNRQYAQSVSENDARNSQGWSGWQKGCFTVIILGILLVVAIAVFTDCSDNNEPVGISDTQEARGLAVERARPTPIPPPTPVPTPTFDQLKSEAVEIDYDDLFRNNEKHVGNRIRFVAKIVQVITVPDKDNQFVLRGNVTRGTYSWDDAVLLDYAGPRLLEDDVVEVVGTVAGLFTYEAVLGNEVTVPHIRVVASQRVEEVDRAVITQTPIVVVETVEVKKEVVKEVVVEVEKLVVQTVAMEKVVEVEKVLEVEEVIVATATPTSTQIPTPLPSPTPGSTETPTPTATPSPTPEPPSTPAELVERVQDSVVRVQARSGGTLFGTTSQGSGFIFAIEGTTAFVATNHHIIDGSNSVEVQIGDSSTYDALVLGWDAERDVAVVSICCSSDFIALQWGDASPSEGDSVVALGYPNSETGNLITTIGEVLGPDDLSMDHDFIPHSAPLNPGNSGGPLFSMPGGALVGINTAGGTEALVFYAVPYQAIAQQVADWRSQLLIVPEPTPSPIIPFATIEGENYAYTVNEIRDPVQPLFGVKTGNRLVAIDVSLVALVDGAYYNPGFFALQDEDGYMWNDWTWPDIDPGLSHGYLAAGQKVRGWIAFEVPQSSLITSVLVEDSRRTVIIADLTRD